MRRGVSSADGSPETVSFQGRILFLIDDPEVMRRQLLGASVDPLERSVLRDDVSTDEIIPARECYQTDQRLGEAVYTGLQVQDTRPVQHRQVRAGGFVAVVSGENYGKGSSREHAPFAEMMAGMRVVIAKSFSPIYEQNCHNLGLFTTSDFEVVEMIESGWPVPMELFLRRHDQLTAEIIRKGGLFAYNRERMTRRLPSAAPQRPRTPMTLSEKILAAHWRAGPPGRVGAPAVQPGDTGFVACDLRFSHEYVTPMAAQLFEEQLGRQGLSRIHEVDSVLLFEDHLTLLERVAPTAGATPSKTNVSAAKRLGVQQSQFAHEKGIKLYGPRPQGGSEGISHLLVTEERALPGHVIAGSDSHTCHAGAVGCFAVGVGTTDIANAWYTGDIRVRVPETVRIELNGVLAANATAKDVVLLILSSPWARQGLTRGRVVEYTGAGLASFTLDERTTLTNMATEMGAVTGIVTPDEGTAAFLVERRRMELDDARALCARWQPDAGANYARTVAIDLASIEPMVALPDDPSKGVPARTLEPTRIDAAYGGSCTGGKATDMDLYAAVLRAALGRGQRVASHVRFYIQCGSVRVWEHCLQHSYLDLFQEAGAILVEPACGACINAGPGVSSQPHQVTISAQNRNFPGRSGPGRLYLASPLTVAASAVAGVITAYDA
jgi:3-isopropylmalate/(R)-2-methylmalate dehydratase large subunit